MTRLHGIEVPLVLSVLRVESAVKRVNGGYIVGPGYDWFFFILSPLLAVAVGYASLKSGLGRVFMYYRDSGGSIQRLFLMATLNQIFTNAHLAIVFLRSHANVKIFRLYPLRFTLVPLLIWAAAVSSRLIFVLTGFVAFWWDDYHSALQTFGLGRNYESAGGERSQPRPPRRLPHHMVIYLGPLLASANLAKNARSLLRGSRAASWAI